MNNLKRIFLNKQMLIYNFVNFDEKCLSFGSSVKKKVCMEKYKIYILFHKNEFMNDFEPQNKSALMTVQYIYYKKMII